MRPHSSRLRVFACGNPGCMHHGFSAWEGMVYESREDAKTRREADGSTLWQRGARREPWTRNCLRADAGHGWVRADTHSPDLRVSASLREELPAACIKGSAHRMPCILNRAETRRRGDGLRDPPSGIVARGESPSLKKPCVWIGRGSRSLKWDARGGQARRLDGDGPIQSPGGRRGLPERDGVGLLARPGDGAATTSTAGQTPDVCVALLRPCADGEGISPTRAIPSVVGTPWPW